MIRLVTGASWVDVEAIMGFEVSDTTLRARRDEWIAAGVFDELCKEALAAFDRIVGLDLEEVALDGSLHKAPCGGEGTGPNPTDRAKIGWKWSVASERHGVPIGWAISGANRNGVRLLEPTLGAVAAAGLLEDIGTLHLDRGYDYPVVRSRLAALGINDVDIQRRGTKQPGTNTRCGSGFAGSSNPPTPGCRTTDNCAATPTAEAPTATPPYASPPPCSSSASYSTTETAGAPHERLSAQPLRALEGEVSSATHQAPARLTASHSPGYPHIFLKNHLPIPYVALTSATRNRYWPQPQHAVANSLVFQILPPQQDALEGVMYYVKATVCWR